MRELVSASAQEPCKHDGFTNIIMTLSSCHQVPAQADVSWILRPAVMLHNSTAQHCLWLMRLLHVSPAQAIASHASCQDVLSVTVLVEPRAQLQPVCSVHCGCKFDCHKGTPYLTQGPCCNLYVQVNVHVLQRTPQEVLCHIRYSTSQQLIRQKHV